MRCLFVSLKKKAVILNVVKNLLAGNTLYALTLVSYEEILRLRYAALRMTFHSPPQIQRFNPTSKIF